MLGCQEGNDVWGYTDSYGYEYALAACDAGTAMVDVSDPSSPIYLGFLPTSTVSSSWRDLKVYKNYVYIGSEATNHGLQVIL